MVGKMENSKIEWTDHTFNPWIGCQHVSPGCDHCYAETQNAFRKWNGVLGVRTRRGSEPQSRIGKIPSSGMQKLARLDESTAVGHVCSVRRLLMCLIIRLPQSGVVTFCIDSGMPAPGLAVADEATTERSQNAAIRLGRWLSQRVAWHDRREPDVF
jgi:hypothetical protein